MDPNVALTCHDKAVALLREVDTDLAVTVDAVRPNEDGEVLLGLLGWLPYAQRLRLCWAVLLAHPPDSTCAFKPEDPYTTAKAIAYDDAAWNRVITDEYRIRRDAAIKVWVLLGHPVQVDTESSGPADGRLGDGQQGQAEDAERVPPVADLPRRDEQAGQADELQQDQGDRPGV